MKFTKEQCNEIISWHKDFKPINVTEAPSDVVTPAGMVKSKLNYNIAEVYRNEKTQWFFDFIYEYLLDLYPNNTVNEGEFFYLHRWDKGNMFKKHIDKKRNNTWKLVCGATLNSDYKGGELIAYDPEEQLGIVEGKLYLMHSERLHEVKEVLEGVRYSFVYFLPAPILGQTKSVI